MRNLTASLWAAALLAVAACESDGNRVRAYRELYIPPPAPGASPGAMAAPSGVATFPELQWEAPAGWLESRGEGMRAATFTVVQDGRTGECTIVRLAGAAGGLEANIRRWLRQQDMVQPSSDELRAFIDKQATFTTAGGHSGRYIDFTTLLSGDLMATASLLGAVVPMGENTIFVKFTGPSELLRAERERFENLCTSLRRRD